MSSTNFEFNIFSNGVQVLDDDGLLKPPDQIKTRPPCGIDRRVCEKHRRPNNKQATLPVPSPARVKSWVARFKMKAQELVASFAGQPQQNADLAVICADFRFPVIKSVQRFLRSAPPCCLLLEVQVYWRDVDEQPKIWEYLDKVSRFIGLLAFRGTVAMEISFKIILERRELGGCEEYLQAVLGPRGLRGTFVQHVDFGISVEQLQPHSIKMHRFKGSRENTLDEFQGESTNITMEIGEILGFNNGRIQFTE